ncbi:MAG: NADH:flavin oxidoreductase [Bacteroidetes bacterium]|nr:MAG: NADH:flavin oxidoreductase [Bacteroidota bacterium]
MSGTLSSRSSGEFLNTAFTPFTLGNLTLKNRFIKAATYEGMYKNGIPTQDLIDFHSNIARGGTAMTTVAYGAVHPDGRTHEEQLLISKASLPMLSQLTSSVHQHGGLASIQLTHCGFFTRNKHLLAGVPKSASRTFNTYGLMSGLPFARSMSHIDIAETTRDFARAALQVKDAGFDAIEVHMGHGYLLSQFLSPTVNKRHDAYGGSRSKRMRFPLEVIRSIRQTVGDSFPILVKLNLSDGFNGGFSIQDCIETAKGLEQEGVDAIVLSGGYTSKTPFFLMRGDVPKKRMVEVEKNRLQKIAISVFGNFVMKSYPFEENYFMSLALQVRREVQIPLIYLGGAVSSQGIHEIMSQGFDAIALGRALIHNPDFLAKIQSDSWHVSPCDHCNQCMVEMDCGGVRCVL